MGTNTIEFEQVIEKGCGLDVHKETAVATVRGKGLKTETRTFSTFTSSLKDMKEWLREIGITHIAMESTGVYWKPPYQELGPNYLLERKKKNKIDYLKRQLKELGYNVEKIEKAA